MPSSKFGERSEYHALLVEQAPPCPQKVDKVNCSSEDHHQVVAVHDEECRTFSLSNCLLRFSADVVERHEDPTCKLAFSTDFAMKDEQLAVTYGLTLPLRLEEVHAVIELEGTVDFLADDTERTPALQSAGIEQAR